MHSSFKLGRLERYLGYSKKKSKYIIVENVFNSEICIPALNKTMKRLADVGQTLESYNYDNEEIGRIILEEIGDVKFEGISVS